MDINIDQHSQPTPTNEDDINLRSSGSSDLGRDEDGDVYEEKKNHNHFQHADSNDLEEVNKANDTSPSVIRFDARFSTLESNRDNQKLKFNNRQTEQEVDVPRAHSEFPPVTSEPLEEQSRPEFRPSTNVTRN